MIMNKLQITKSKPSFDLKKTAGIFNNLLLLISKSYFRNARGPLFMFVVPTFFTVLFFFILGNKFSGHMSLYGYMLLPALTIMTSLAPAIVEWKNSVFLKRIDTTGVKKSMFLGALWSFYVILGFVAFIFMIIISLILSLIAAPSQDEIGFKGTLIESFAKINWGFLILSLLLVMLTTIGIATLFGGLFNNEGSMQGIIMMVYFFSLFLSGIMLPPVMFEKSQFMIGFTYIIPLKYAVFLFLYATQGFVDASGWNSSFNNHEINGIYIQDFSATWQPILGAILIIVALFITTTFTFKWVAKK